MTRMIFGELRSEERAPRKPDHLAAAHILGRKTGCNRTITRGMMTTKHTRMVTCKACLAALHSATVREPVAD